MTKADSKQRAHPDADVEKKRGKKRPSGRRRVRSESGSASSDSGRLRHREQPRSEETEHEPRRGELSTGQEP